MKGEIVTLATAVIVGGAFGKIVTSFTNDVLMPPIGLLLGKVDFYNFERKLIVKRIHLATSAVNFQLKIIMIVLISD